MNLVALAVLKLKKYSLLVESCIVIIVLDEVDQ